MFKGSKKPKKIDFLLESSHYRKLHLYLYLLTIIIIILFYLIVLFIFSITNVYITGIISIGIGLYMVFNKDRLVKLISDIIQEKDFKSRKKESKDGLRNTIRKIIPKPKRNIKLSIGGRDTIRDKFNNFKKKFNFKKKKEEDRYIEIK